mgnify:CR=1 FL=1
MKKKQKITLYRIIITAVMLVVLQFLPITGIPRLIAYLAAYLVIGYDILRKAGKGILNGRAFDENFLMALATLGAFFLAIWTKSGDYLEGIAVMLFYQIGELFQSYAVGKSRKNISALMDIRPDYANIEKDGKLEQVDPDEVAVGSIIVVQPGEKVPLDGVVESGNASLNTSALTGESLPRDVKEGDEIISGCINLNGVLKIRTTKEFGESTVSKILDLVENASSRKSRSEAFISRFAKIYTPAVCISAVLLGIAVPLLRMAFGMDAAWVDWIYRALTFLVVSCPCALGLATPVAIMVGSGMGAKNGILFKTAVSLEKTGKVQIVALDKTGTITSGEPRVTDILSAPGITEKNLLEAASALEKKSEHPLAKAIMARAEEIGVQAKEVTDFMAKPGNGLTAALNGEVLAGGNLKFISTQADVSADFKEKAEALARSGKTPLYFSRGGKLIGVIAVADVIKEDSPQAIRELQNMGIHVVMLTGDNARTAEAIGRQAGVNEVIAGVLPDGKENVIRKLREQGEVMMVGDGINDAPALTRADIGVAIGAGTDIAIDAADVVLMKSRLSDVPAGIRLSRATLRNIHENLFWAFIYNIIGIPLAAGVFIPRGLTLSPMFGAAAMSLSSFCVVTNALRLNLLNIRSTKHDKKIKSAKPAEMKTIEVKETKTMEKTIKINGMMCPHCEATVKKCLEAFPQVTSAEVSHEKGTAVIQLNAEISDAELKKAIEDKGYEIVG